MEITVEILKQIAPGSKKTNYNLLPSLAEWMNYWFPKFEIDQKGEYCHFLAQAAHETDSFNTLEEYASGKAYEGRKDLGNLSDGDGVRYKGRGIFQITGKVNYRQATMDWAKRLPATLINFVMEPHYLQAPQFAVWSACQYWHNRDFNTIANMPNDAKIWSKKLNRDLSPLEYITWRINGGFNGLQSRIKFYEKAKEIINE